MKRTVLPYLAEHYSHWGWLPFGQKPAAAPSWFDPQTASYQTSPPATQGHLPVALDSSYLAWTNEAIAKVGIPGSLTGSYPCNLYSFIGPPGAPDDGMPVPRVTLRCTRDYSGPTVGYSFSARLDKAAMALVRSVTIDVTVTGGSGALPTRTVSVTGPDATLTYTGTLTGTTGTVTFDLVAEVSNLNAVLPSEDVAWMFKNGWHRLIYYSVAEGAKPGASTTCPIDCLTVNVQGATSSARAVLVLPGRGVERAAGAWQTRPSGAAIDYFEGLNAALPATTFEQRMRGRQFDASDTYTGVFNDRVVPFN